MEFGLSRVTRPGRASLVSELKGVRNQWAHHEQFSGNDAVRALDSIERLLNAVSAGEKTSEVGQMRMDLLRVISTSNAGQEMRKRSFVATEGKPQGGLKAVAGGRHTPSRRRVGPLSAGGIRRRSCGRSTRAKAQTNTRTRPSSSAARSSRRGCGGCFKVPCCGWRAKAAIRSSSCRRTSAAARRHSILALYHPFSGTPASGLPGVEELVRRRVPVAQNVERASFVGTQISPGQQHKKAGRHGRPHRSGVSWLGSSGGKEGYEMVTEDDERATNPGDALKELFNKYAPCLILIDEWVAYARQLARRRRIFPAGTFDTQFTFAQALSESAKAAKQTLLVVSIPASESPHQRVDHGVTDIEIGGERGARPSPASRTPSDASNRRGDRPAPTKDLRSSAAAFSSR